MGGTSRGTGGNQREVFGAAGRRAIGGLEGRAGCLAQNPATNTASSQRKRVRGIAREREERRDAAVEDRGIAGPFCRGQRKTGRPDRERGNPCPGNAGMAGRDEPGKGCGEQYAARRPADDGEIHGERPGGFSYRGWRGGGGAETSRTADANDNFAGTAREFWSGRGLDGD